MGLRLADVKRRWPGFDGSGFAGGLLASLSIAAGYVPVAISFGLVGVQAGLSPLAAVLVSALVFAGASQFVLVSLLASGAGFAGALLTVLLMNARHVFYGPALARKLPRGPSSRWSSAWLAAGLTDEVFATALARLDRVPERRREVWYLGLQLGAYAAWVGGTAVGAVSGAQFARLPALAQHAIGFVLPALFMALLLELAARDDFIVALAAVAVTLLALQIWPAYQAIPIGMVVGALCMSWKRPFHEPRNGS